MKKNKNKKKIVIIIVCCVLLIVIGALIFMKTNKEKSVLYCYKETKQNEHITQFNSYEVFEGKNTKRILQRTKTKLSESIYNKINQSGYDMDLLYKYFQQATENELKSKFGVLEDTIIYNVNNTNYEFEIEVQYIINSNNAHQFKEVLGFDYYNNQVKQIKKYYESGEMVCEKR